jgi:hypothetical protein
MPTIIPDIAMKYRPIQLLSALLLASLVTAARAQMPGSPDTGMFSASLRKILGQHNAFSATTDVHIFNKAGQETTAMTMGFATLGGNARIDVDTAALRTKDVAAEVIAQFKALGMDKMVTIVRPDKKLSYVIYPGLKSFAELAMSAEEAAARSDDLAMQKSAQGKETVDGHPTQKTKVVVTGKNKETKEYLVWYATDLKDFPLKLQTTEGPTTMVMTFRDIKSTAPEAKQFEAPVGYVKYAGIEQLVQAEIMKRMGAGGAAK